MRYFAQIFLCFFLVFLSLSSTFAQNKQKIALVIHGGAGGKKGKVLSPEQETAYKAKLQEALDSGYAVLERGGTSREAVTTAIIILEDSPLFNAGKGAVLTNVETVEMDASIMDGKTHEAGAIARVQTIKNPILAARAVLENSPHVLLVGEGAEIFAKQEGLQFEDKAYFKTEKALKSLQRVQAREKAEGSIIDPSTETEKFGTVGAVALDKERNITAATSTGGMTNKRYGRVGDSPIIGAGTYADNETCGVSSTGHGEFFMRYLVAYDISALMKYRNYKLKKATHEVLQKKLTKVEGYGGVIALDKDGNVSMEFNTPQMFRAYRDAKGKSEVLIY